MELAAPFDARRSEPRYLGMNLGIDVMVSKSSELVNRPWATADRIQLMLATGGGTGLLPWAPGSWGTLPAVAIYAGVVYGIAIAWQWAVLGALAIVFSGLSLAVSPWAIRYWEKKDPDRFVLDELAGYLVAVAIFPGPWAFDSVEITTTTLLWMCVWSYLAFRLFDAVKPPPVNWFERLPGGWGILCDDLFAGVYAGGVLHLLLVVAPHWYGID